MSKPNIQIPELVASNLEGLGRLCRLFESQDQPSQSSVQSYLARFKLWAGSLGAHRASGARSMEYRLRDASSIRKHLISLLQELKDLVVEEALPFLESVHEAEGESETEGGSVDDELAGLFNAGSEDVVVSSGTSRNMELDNLLSGIGNVIDCLLRLSITISNPAPHDHFRSRAGVELTQAFTHYDTRHVRDKYPKIQPNLSERLGRMLTHRRRYFKYREDHHFRLMQGLEGAFDDGASKGLATTVASSLPQALKDGPQIHLTVDDDRSEISATSYAPSTLSQSELRVPPIPKEYVDGPFLCPYCYIFISVDSRNDWKKHVFRDLRPYACLVETCLVDHDFPRRKEWIRHMLKDHWRAWNCPFGCLSEYPSSSGLRDHLFKSHTTEVMGQDVEAIANLSSKADVSCAEGPCPLCHDFIKSSHQYQSHVGYHLEQLALFVLPTQDDNDDDQDCSDDDRSGTSRDINHEEEETTSLHQVSREQGAEKRTQSDIEEQDDSVRDPSPPPPPTSAPGPPRTPLPAEEKPNPQMEQMKKQLEILTAERREQEELEKQADIERKIREDAKSAFKIRMKEMQKAREEAKKEIEFARIAAERAARNRIDNERKEEGEHQRQPAEAMTKAERETREKYEAALKAEEERKAQQDDEQQAAEEAKRKKLYEEVTRLKAEKELWDKIATVKKAEEEDKISEYAARFLKENEARLELEKERLAEEEAKEKEEDAKKEREDLLKKIEEETNVMVAEGTKKMAGDDKA